MLPLHLSKLQSFTIIFLFLFQYVDTKVWDQFFIISYPCQENEVMVYLRLANYKRDGWQKSWDRRCMVRISWLLWKEGVGDDKCLQFRWDYDTSSTACLKIIKAFGRKRTWEFMTWETLTIIGETFRWLTGDAREPAVQTLRHTFFRLCWSTECCLESAAHLATCGLTRAVKPLQAQVAKRYQIKIKSSVVFNWHL